LEAQYWHLQEIPFHDWLQLVRNLPVILYRVRGLGCGFNLEAGEKNLAKHGPKMDCCQPTISITIKT